MFGDANSSEFVEFVAGLYKSGHSLRKIANALGISHMTVYRILRGKVKLRPRVPR